MLDINKIEDSKIEFNKKDNKVILLIDSGIDIFVLLLVRLIKIILPPKLESKIDEYLSHKEVLHNVVGLTFFNALGGICVIITQVKLANYLGASIFGIYSYCLAIGEVGAMFVRYGRNKTMIRDLIQYPQKKGTLITSTLYLSLINLLIFMIVTFAFYEKLEIDITIAYILLIMSPCLISIDPGPVYESLRLMSWHSVYLLIQKFLFLFFIWILFLSKFTVGLTTIGVILTATWILVLVIQFWEIAKQLKINFFKSIKLSDIWFLYKDNFVIFLSCVFGVAFGPLIQLILKQNAETQAVGVYAAGLQIYQICLFFNNQISRVGNPVMAELGKNTCPIVKRKTVVKKYTAIMLVTALPFVIPMVLFPQQIVNCLYSSEYESLSIYLPILAIYLIAISIGVVFTQFLISIRKDRLYFYIYIGTAVATVLCSLILIPQYKIMGAFLSLCIPNSIGCLLYFLFSIKYLKS